jgi:hypothetical protein
VLYPQTASSAIRSAVAVTVTAKLGEVVHGRASRLLSDPFADAARCRRLPKGGRPLLRGRGHL